MNSNVNNLTEILQETSLPTEQFFMYQFCHSLGKGAKALIKSHGCQWSSLHKGWLCPIDNFLKIEKVLNEASFQFKKQPVLLPQGFISSNPKVASIQTRLDILEEDVYKEDASLLVDVVNYNPSLRPTDFEELPTESNKSETQVLIERDCHLRYRAQQYKKEEIERLRAELFTLSHDPCEKIIDSEAPLKTAEMFLRQ